MHSSCAYLMGLKFSERDVLKRDLSILDVLQWPWFFDSVYTYLLWWVFILMEGGAWSPQPIIILAICSLIYMCYRITQKREKLKVSLITNLQLNTNTAYDMTGVLEDDLSGASPSVGAELNDINLDPETPNTRKP
eukprot:UN33794